MIGISEIKQLLGVTAKTVNPWIESGELKRTWMRHPKKKRRTTCAVRDDDFIEFLSKHPELLKDIDVSSLTNPSLVAKIEALIVDLGTMN